MDCSHQAPPSVGSLGKNPGVGCHALLQGKSSPILQATKIRLSEIDFSQIKPLADGQVGFDFGLLDFAIHAL